MQGDKSMKDSIQRIRTLLTSGRPGQGRSSRYYRNVIAPGAGYPTFDEARKDLDRRDRAVSVPPWWHS
jgi:hypothetical protein